MEAAKKQSISKGQVIHTPYGAFVVSGCGNGMYSGSFKGSKAKLSLPCADLHADLDSGRAILGNADAYRAHETARSYTASARRDVALYNALAA